jgi:hypothetical protein
MSTPAARRQSLDLWRLLRAFLLGCYLALFAAPGALLAVLLPLPTCVAILSAPPWPPPAPSGPRAGRSPRAPPTARPPRQPTP